MWRTFVQIASPVQVAAIRLRYINRILIPMVGGEVDLEEYLRVAPLIPKGAGLELVGFLSQQLAVETDTGNQVNIVLSPQAPEAAFCDRQPSSILCAVGRGTRPGGGRQGRRTGLPSTFGRARMLPVGVC